jgi:hypothetical protein
MRRAWDLEMGWGWIPESRSMEASKLASQFISEDGGVDWLLFLGGENDIRIYDSAMCCESFFSYLGALVAAISLVLHIPIMSL